LHHRPRGAGVFFQSAPGAPGDGWRSFGEVLMVLSALVLLGLLIGFTVTGRP